MSRDGLHVTFYLVVARVGAKRDASRPQGAVPGAEVAYESWAHQPGFASTTYATPTPPGSSTTALTSSP